MASVHFSILQHSRDKELANKTASIAATIKCVTQFSENVREEAVSPHQEPGRTGRRVAEGGGEAEARAEEERRQPQCPLPRVFQIWRKMFDGETNNLV